MQNDERFIDLKRAFRAVRRDPGWWWKVLMGGPMLFFPLTFLIPMGFTMEVLRRAKNDRQNFILPSFHVKHWWTYAKEGLVKLVIAFGTLLGPALAWMAFSWAVAIIVGFPGSNQWPFFFDKILPFAGPLAFFITLPFCAVGCCRYLDTGNVMTAAFDYSTNIKIYREGIVDFSLGAVFVLGMNFIAQTWFFPIPWCVFVGLCVVDNWFAPTYNEAAQRVAANEKRERELAAQEPKRQVKRLET